MLLKVDLGIESGAIDGKKTLEDTAYYKQSDVS
jgi:hypothetical protein